MSDHAVPVLEITPKSGWRPFDVVLLWRYRELLWFLMLRDFKVRYRQTIIGLAWVTIQPLALLFVFTAFVGRMTTTEQLGAPYALLVLCALPIWQLFAHAMTAAGVSVVANEHLITKVYFPRIILPFASTCVGMIDAAVSLLILIVASWYTGLFPGANVVYAPLFLLLALISAFGIGCWLSALTVYFRDFRHVVPFMSQILLLATPLAYPSTIVPLEWRLWYALNPLVGAIDGVRWAWLGLPLSAGSVTVSAIAAAVLLVSGVAAFNLMERRFADVI
jgi:lipopolysaccharide transport system permease protein